MQARGVGISRPTEIQNPNSVTLEPDLVDTSVGKRSKAQCQIKAHSFENGLILLFA